MFKKYFKAIGIPAISAIVAIGVTVLAIYFIAINPIKKTSKALDNEISTLNTQNETLKLDKVIATEEKTKITDELNTVTALANVAKSETDSTKTQIGEKNQQAGDLKGTIESKQAEMNKAQAQADKVSAELKAQSGALAKAKKSVDSVKKLDSLFANYENYSKSLDANLAKAGNATSEDAYNKALKDVELNLSSLDMVDKQIVQVFEKFRTENS